MLPTGPTPAPLPPTRPARVRCKRGDYYRLALVKNKTIYIELKQFATHNNERKTIIIIIVYLFYY